LAPSPAQLVQIAQDVVTGALPYWRTVFDLTPGPAQLVQIAQDVVAGALPYWRTVFDLAPRLAQMMQTKKNPPKRVFFIAA
jgi:hypothetical protein